jgi:sigma-B regulation protein RsbU (phosphoserine phosphatase)
MMPLTFPVFPDRKEIDIYAALYPATELGGDFFDFFFTAKNKLCFVVGDVSGHGVASALQMAVSKTLINSKALTDSSTAAILTLVNDELSKNNDSSMFVTMFLGILDLETGALTYTNAGHNPPYIKRNNGSIERLDTLHGPVIGAVADLEYKESASKLLKNDAILLYTDGITEAMDTGKNLFTEKRLVEIISTQSKSSKDVVQRTVKAVKEFENEAEQADDITILAIKFLG